MNIGTARLFQVAQTWLMLKLLYCNTPVATPTQAGAGKHHLVAAGDTASKDKEGEKGMSVKHGQVAKTTDSEDQRVWVWFLSYLCLPSSDVPGGTKVVFEELKLWGLIVMLPLPVSILPPTRVVKSICWL